MAITRAARIVVIIPARDEEEAIGKVLAEIPPVSEVVVVDNGSTDATAQQARAGGARVVSEPRPGYGRACLAGIAAAPQADILVFLDGDGSDYPEQLPALVAPILSGEADLVIGSRSLGRRAPGAQPWHAVLGTRLSVALMNRLIGTHATDLGPFRAISAEALRRLDMKDENFGWTVEMQAKAHERGLRVREVPVDYRPRLGRSKISGTLTGSLRAGAKILATIAGHAVSRSKDERTPRDRVRTVVQHAPPTLAPQARRNMTLGACAAVLSACVAFWAWRGDQTGRIASHLAVYGAAFGAYLLALHAARGLSPRRLRLAVGLAIAWRVALILAPPLLSDDVNRSVWEGRIQLHGGNPYVWTDRPEAARWLGLRDAVWHGLNHKGYTAIYPPFWQLAARGVVAACDSVTFMKAFLVGCELVGLWVLGGLLRAMGLPSERLLVQAWSPLALVEIAGSGHNEALGMLCLVLSLAFLTQGKGALAAMAAALGAQAKFLPGLVAVAWTRRFRARHVLAGLAVAAVPVLPYLDAGPGFLMSLGKYAQFWRFNETLFAAAAALAGTHARAVGVVVFLLLVVAARLAWSRADPVTASLAVVVAILALSPNVLPWYALWLLPLLALRDFPPALLFSGTVSLAYLVYPLWQSGEPWRIGWGIRLLEYGPCLTVALWCGGSMRYAPGRSGQPCPPPVCGRRG